MTSLAAQELISLWKDPDARWRSGAQGHPCGEIELEPERDPDAVRLLEMSSNTWSSTMSMTFGCASLPE
jgi:hypothetical protein